MPLTVKPEAAAIPQAAPDRFRQLVGRATRLSTNFRFQPNSVALDNRGQRDLDRLVNFIVSVHAASTQVILVGFADNTGNPIANLAVSKKRAEAVAAGLAERGLRVGQVAAFGAELPVADNNSDDGREKNRRVEVYVQL
ncbi:MAG: OmpA family protein [Rhodospirillales bacterium]